MDCVRHKDTSLLLKGLQKARTGESLGPVWIQCRKWSRKEIGRGTDYRLRIMPCAYRLKRL